VTELCSGQALADAAADNDADTDAAAADKSNPYMSPFQGDTITISILCAFIYFSNLPINGFHCNFKKPSYFFLNRLVLEHQPETKLM
jgi:hypothetical protein